MRRRLPGDVAFGVLGVLGILIAWMGSPHAGQPARMVTAIVDRVSDGDSVIATDARGTKLRIRLLGVDAPEIAHGKLPGQPFGEEARQYLDSLIGGKVVTVEAHGPDQYKRVLAVIWDDQINVNLLMVAMGYAEVYRGALCQAYCEGLFRAEGKAKRDKEGMWVQGQKYESPRAFRQRMKIQGN